MKRSLLVLSLVAGCGTPNTTPPPSARSEAQSTLVFPTYDQVVAKATHNAYWLRNSPDGTDALASGVQERMIDQLLHERVRSFELDLHFDAGHARISSSITPTPARRTRSATRSKTA